LARRKTDSRVFAKKVRCRGEHNRATARPLS